MHACCLPAFLCFAAVAGVLSGGCSVGDTYGKGFAAEYHGVTDSTTYGQKYVYTQGKDSAEIAAGLGHFLVSADRGDSSVTIERVDGFAADFSASTAGTPLSFSGDEKPLPLSPATHLLTVALRQYVPTGVVGYQNGVAVGLGVDAISLEAFVKIDFAAGHTYRLTARRVNSAFDLTLWDETGAGVATGPAAKPVIAGTWEFAGANHFDTTIYYAKHR